jgi:hypothetical protein
VLIVVAGMLIPLAVSIRTSLAAGNAARVDRSTRIFSMSILTTNFWRGGGVRNTSTPSSPTFVRSGVTPCGGERASFRSSSRPRNGPFDTKGSRMSRDSEPEGCGCGQACRVVGSLEPIFVETRFEIRFGLCFVKFFQRDLDISATDM